MLIQLKDGTWVDPASVMAVHATHDEVIIVLSATNQLGNMTHCFPSNTPEVDRDILAERLNAALYEWGKK